jgi:hypothetical protein
MLLYITKYTYFMTKQHPYGIRWQLLLGTLGIPSRVSGLSCESRSFGHFASKFGSRWNHEGSGEALLAQKTFMVVSQKGSKITSPDHEK